MKRMLGPLCISILIALTLGDYHSDYTRWEILYRARTGGFVDKAAFNSVGLDRAISKSEEFPEYSQEEKDAVIIVYLYTMENEEIKYNIYTPLNKGLRDSNLNSPFFLGFANLLNQAIKVLGRKQSDSVDSTTLYRGMRFCNSIPAVNKIYTFKGFVSTSTNAGVAFRFTNQGNCAQRIFMVFENAGHAGLSVHQYSEYSRENEVLLASGIQATVQINLNKTENADASIRSQTTLINEFPNDQTVNVFIKFVNIQVPESSSASTSGANHAVGVTAENAAMLVSLIIMGFVII